MQQEYTLEQLKGIAFDIDMEMKRLQNEYSKVITMISEKMQAEQKKEGEEKESKTKK